MFTVNILVCLLTSAMDQIVVNGSLAMQAIPVVALLARGVVVADALVDSIHGRFSFCGSLESPHQTQV